MGFAFNALKKKSHVTPKFAWFFHILQVTVVDV